MSRKKYEFTLDESGNWKTLFRQLSFACDMLDAMLSRAERENLCNLCDYWSDGHYCEAASCVIHHREHCENFSRAS